MTSMQARVWATVPARWRQLTPRARRLVGGLVLSLLAGLGVAVQEDVPDDDGVALAPRAAAARPVTVATAAVASSAPLAWPTAPRPRPPWPRVAGAQAWGPEAVKVAAPPPITQAAEAPPPPAGPPAAPPFPYTLIGRVEDGPLIQALLSSPRRTLGVKAKDVIDGQWRVDAVDARGVTLTWLPGGQALTLAMRPS